MQKRMNLFVGVLTGIFLFVGIGVQAQTAQPQNEKVAALTDLIVQNAPKKEWRGKARLFFGGRGTTPLQCLNNAGSMTYFRNGSRGLMCSDSEQPLLRSNDVWPLFGFLTDPVSEKIFLVYQPAIQPGDKTFADLRKSGAVLSNQELDEAGHAAAKELTSLRQAQKIEKQRQAEAKKKRQMARAAKRIERKINAIREAGQNWDDIGPAEHL